MTLDKKLVRLRKKEGLSQADVSEKLDVSRQAVTKWETGTSRPSTENLQALSKLYNVPLEYLLDESADELPTAALAAPETPVAESGPEREVQKKGRQRIRWLVIGAVVFVLLGCVLSWYKNNQKNDMDDLHTLQREDTTLDEVPKFDLNWD
nr:helix-turn-helix transcriptional regulator [uncultured Dysosmobacter sp.]